MCKCLWSFIVLFTINGPSIGGMTEDRLIRSIDWEFSSWLFGVVTPVLNCYFYYPGGHRSCIVDIYWFTFCKLNFIDTAGLLEVYGKTIFSSYSRLFLLLIIFTSLRPWLYMAPFLWFLSENYGFTNLNVKLSPSPPLIVLWFLCLYSWCICTTFCFGSLWSDWCPIVWRCLRYDMDAWAFYTLVWRFVYNLNDVIVALFINLKT